MKSKKNLKVKRKNTSIKNLRVKRKIIQKKGSGREGDQLKIENDQLKIENERYKQFLEYLGYGDLIEISIITQQGESKHLIGKKESVYKALKRFPNIGSHHLNSMCPNGSFIVFGDTPITKDDTVEDLGIEDGGRIDVNIIGCDMQVVHRDFRTQTTYSQCTHCKKSHTNY